MAEITIDTISGKMQIEATVYGLVAVHNSIDINCVIEDDCFAVTYIPTGMCMAEYSALHIAHNFARRISERFDLSRLLVDLDMQVTIYRMRKHPSQVVALNHNELAKYSPIDQNRLKAALGLH